MRALPVILPESPESDITATSRVRTSGSFRLIHIDEFGVDRDPPALFGTIFDWQTRLHKVG